MSKNITHEGVVVGIDGKRVIVQFVQHSACSGCHAKALCSGGSSEEAEKRVVANSYGVTYHVGDVVRVVVTSGMAWSAVLIAFATPLVLAMVCLFATVKLSGSEMTGCWVTLLFLALYFFGIWCMRSKLERRVEFLLEKV